MVVVKGNKIEWMVRVMMKRRLRVMKWIVRLN